MFDIKSSKNLFLFFKEVPFSSTIGLHITRIIPRAMPIEQASQTTFLPRIIMLTTNFQMKFNQVSVLLHGIQTQPFSYTDPVYAPSGSQRNLLSCRVMPSQLSHDRSTPEACQFRRAVCMASRFRSAVKRATFDFFPAFIQALTLVDARTRNKNSQTIKK